MMNLNMPGLLAKGRMEGTGGDYWLKGIDYPQ